MFRARAYTIERCSVGFALTGRDPGMRSRRRWVGSR
jgi:hypothetical protein